MTGSAIFTFIATILTVAPGVVEIDFGSNGGLQVGDTGVIFYEFGVRDEVESVEIGPASVFETSADTAKLRIAPDLRVQAGFLVRFELPRSRLADDSSSPSTDLDPVTGIAYVANTNNSCLKLRSGPATDTATLACVPEGASVSIIGSVADWQRARIADGREGWLASRFLAESKPAAGVAPPAPAAPAAPAAPKVSGDRFEVEIHDSESHYLEPSYAQPRLEPEPGHIEPRYAEPDYRNRAPEASSGDLGQQLGEADVAVERLLGQLSRNDADLDEVERERSELSRRLLETTVSGFESRLARARADLEHTENARSQLARQLDSLAEVRRRLEEQLEASLVSAQEVEAQRARLQSELARAHSDLASTRTDLEQAGTLSDGLEGDLMAARADFAGIEKEREQLLVELESTRSELGQIESTSNTAQRVLAKEVENTETELTALRRRLELREGELATARGQLAAAAAERAALKAELDEFDTGGRSGLKRQLIQAKADLQEADREKKALEVWLGDRGRELEQAEARVAIMQAEIDRLETVAPANQREIEATRTALSEASRRAASLEGQLAQSEQETETLQAELSSTNRELAGYRGHPSSSGPQLQEIEKDADGKAELVVKESAEPCLNFRAEPKMDSEIFDCLKPGNRLGALGHWEGWHYVELSDGRAGWVSSEHLASPNTGLPGS